MIRQFNSLQYFLCEFKFNKQNLQDEHFSVFIFTSTHADVQKFVIEFDGFLVRYNDSYFIRDIIQTFKL